MQQQQQKFNKINWFWHLNFFLFSLVQSNEPVYHRQRHQTLDQTRYIHTQTFSHSSIWETKFKDLNKNSIFDSSFGTHINIHTSTLSLLCTKRKKKYHRIDCFAIWILNVIHFILFKIYVALFSIFSLFLPFVRHSILLFVCWWRSKKKERKSTFNLEYWNETNFNVKLCGLVVVVYINKFRIL